MASTSGSIFSDAWIGVDPGSSPMRRTLVFASPTTRMPPLARRFFAIAATRASTVRAGTS